MSLNGSLNGLDGLTAPIGSQDRELVAVNGLDGLTAPALRGESGQLLPA